MPDTSTRTGVNVKAVLNMGLDANGNQKTSGLSLGRLSNTGYNDNGAMAIINALKPCLQRNVLQNQKTEKFDVNTASA